MPEIIATEHWDHFVDYYNRCVKLQGINISSENGRDTSQDLHVDDPLQHFVTIYDVVERKYAGFSNALQQVWCGSQNPKRWQADARFDRHQEIFSEADWLWLFLLHRVTGSGASFQHDHGFRNSIIADAALLEQDRFGMERYVIEQMQAGRPIFTSIGNQIPPFPKPQGPYSRGSELYIGEFMMDLVHDMYEHLKASGGNLVIADTVDWANDWHKAHGLKQFHFVLTAWVMDIAEYFPQYVDPYSRVHYGKNAIEALELLFENDGYKKKDFYDACMDYIVSKLWSPFAQDDMQRQQGKAYSLEDVACDYVRYVGCYVPNGYHHLEPWKVTHSIETDYPKHWTYVNHIERHKNV